MLHVSEISGSSCTVALQLAHPYQARLHLSHPVCMQPVPAQSTWASHKLGATCALHTHGLSLAFWSKKLLVHRTRGHVAVLCSLYCLPRHAAAPPVLGVTLLLPLTKRQKEIKERRDVAGCGLLLALPQDPGAEFQVCFRHEGLAGSRCCLPAPSAPCFPCPSLGQLGTPGQERAMSLSGSLSCTA